MNGICSDGRQWWDVLAKYGDREAREPLTVRTKQSGTRATVELFVLEGYEARCGWAWPRYRLIGIESDCTEDAAIKRLLRKYFGVERSEGHTWTDIFRGLGLC